MVEVRRLKSLEEFAAAVEMQRSIWGWGDLDLLPVRFFVVAEKIGGQILGAFDGPQLCGFLLAIPGVTNEGEIYLHSHMLGILPQYRNAGAGTAMKLAQKQDALARGITRVEWSFDPLDLKNAYFNIEKLGAIVKRYEANLYGYTSSLLQAGLPTDRCIADWDLRRARTKTAPVERISIPAAIADIKANDAARAAEIQRNVAAQFEKCFKQGLAVTGFEHSAASGTYLLSPWPSK